MIERNWYFFQYKDKEVAFKRRVLQILDDGTVVTSALQDESHKIRFHPDDGTHKWWPCSENAPRFIEVEKLKEMR